MVQRYDNRKGRGLRLLCCLVAGAWIVATWVAALLMLRDMGAFWSVVGWAFLGGKGLMVLATAVAMALHPAQAWRVFAGRYRFCPARNDGSGWLRPLLQATTRFGWELPQLFVGYQLAQWRVAVGRVKFVATLDGVTFVVGRHRDPHTCAGMSTGCFVHVWAPHRHTLHEGSDFEDYARRGADNMMRHEYGHTVDSQLWGWLYLPVVGVPSVVSQALALLRGVRHRHETFWPERRADRLGRKYFKGKGEK